MPIELGFRALVGEVEDGRSDNTLIQPDSPWAASAMGFNGYQLTLINNSADTPQIVVFQKP